MNKIDKAITLLLSEEEPLFSNPMVFDDEWLDKHVQGTWIKNWDSTVLVS